MAHDLATAMPTPDPAQPAPRWKVRFFTIWAGQAASIVGSGLVQFALVWWLTTATGSATVLALAALVAVLPNVLIGPFAGVLADRLNRRVILIVADGAIAVTTALLLVIYLLGDLQVWHVYAALLVRSAATAFHFPTMSASTTLLVPTQHLARVSGLNQALNGFVGILSPALGALLLQVANLGMVLAVDIITAALAIAPLLFLRIPQPTLTPEQRERDTGTWVLHDMREGLRYVFGHRGIVYIFIMAALVNMLLVPALSVLPLLVNKVFSGDATHLAVAEILFGVGAIAGGLGIAAWGGFKSKVQTSLLGLAGIGIGFALIGSAPQHLFWLVPVGMFVVGATSALTNGPIMAVFQTVIPQAMQGRVLALLISFAAAMTPLGLILAGPIADSFGLRIWYFLCAGVCIVVALIGPFLKELRKLEETPHAHQRTQPVHLPVAGMPIQSLFATADGLASPPTDLEQSSNERRTR